MLSVRRAIALSFIVQRRTSLRQCNVSVSGQRELKDGAARRIGARPQSSATCFDDRAADRQPQPQAVRLGRMEGLEEVLESTRRQSGTRIAHSDEQVSRLSLFGSDQQFA